MKIVGMLLGRGLRWCDTVGRERENMAEEGPILKVRLAPGAPRPEIGSKSDEQGFADGWSLKGGS